MNSSDIGLGLGASGQLFNVAIDFITDNSILFALFGTMLLVYGFKVFKRTKNAVK